MHHTGQTHSAPALPSCRRSEPRPNNAPSRAPPHPRYLGRLVTGKVCAGRVAIGDQVATRDALALRWASRRRLLVEVYKTPDPYETTRTHISLPPQVVTLARGGDGAPVRKPEKVTGLFVTHGIARAPLDGGAVGVGDIVTLAAAGEVSQS